MHWSKWAGWCGEIKIDPFRSVLSKALDYLSYLFDLGYEYRAAGFHMYATTAYHEYVDNKPVGQHPHVCALLKEVFNERSPQSRYILILNVQTILDFVKSQW